MTLMDTDTRLINKLATNMYKRNRPLRPQSDCSILTLTFLVAFVGKNYPICGNKQYFPEKPFRKANLG